MEEFWQAFSSSHKSQSTRPESEFVYSQQAPTPAVSGTAVANHNPVGASTISSSLPVPSAQSPDNSTRLKKPSRSAVQDALEITRERRRIRSNDSSSVASDRSGATRDSYSLASSTNRQQVNKMLMQPDLTRPAGYQKESRNDRERPLPSNSHLPNHQTEIHVGGHAADELEVSISRTLTDSIGENGSASFDEKKVDSCDDSMEVSSEPVYQPRAAALSPTSLYARADEIILEAQKACSEGGALSYTGGASDNPRSREILHKALGKALDKAVMKMREGDSAPAALADKKTNLTATSKVTQPIVATGGSLDAASSSDDAEPRPQIMSTEEVLQMANGVLRQAGNAASSSPYLSPVPTYSGTKSDDFINKCLSPTESDVNSIDDYENAVRRLPSTLEESEGLPRSKILERIDGIAKSPLSSPTASNVRSPLAASSSVDTVGSNSILASCDETEIKAVTEESIKAVSNLRPEAVKTAGQQKKEWHANTSAEPEKEYSKDTSSGDPEKPASPASSSGFNILSYFWGGGVEVETNDNTEAAQSTGPISHGRMSVNKELPAMEASLVRVTSDPQEAGYAEVVSFKEVDPRMPKWIENQFSAQQPLPMDGTYHLGASRTVIVHEIQRGNWTWCTAWSPDGTQLAVATENHDFAVIDTTSSPVWRVRHDKLLNGPIKKGTTHTIRSIAWGDQFIAIGGTGNAVSILAPTAPYTILHIIPNTGFVGSLDWLPGTNTLAIGSRLGKALIVDIHGESKVPVSGTATVAAPHDIRSTIVHTVDRGKKNWINVVKFSPGGSAVAIGDGKGILAVYSYVKKQNEPLQIVNVANFKLEDAIMAVEWSADGQWLYAGGEDYAITVINSTYWEAVHRIKRDRWVQFISSSKGGSHVAVGGVSSEVSILDVDKGWDTALKISLRGLVPLSASWHPQDQYLVLTGQNNNILAVETTNARYVSGHYLRSVSPILSIEFSPDGRMAAIGNEAGIVTIFKLSGTTFITAYELVLDCDGALSIHWSLSGEYLCVASGSKLVVIAKTRESSMLTTSPPNASGFSVARVVRDLGKVNVVCISPRSRFIAVCGSSTRILDATANFMCVRDYNLPGQAMAASWSRDGNLLATMGHGQGLVIYDTSSNDVANFNPVFSVRTKFTGLALAWGPSNVSGLQYIAYGGDCKQILIKEIRTKEQTWETVLAVPREGLIHELDWSNEGLLAAAVGDGTVTIMDLSYLRSGYAVNEMDYNWQRQALTCFTELRRNKGKNCMRTVRWIPSAPGSDCLLAVGGTDGELEIVDLTERQRCSGFVNVRPSV